MKKLMLLSVFLFASMPFAWSRLVLLSTMLNECDEYWEVRGIELNEAGNMIKNELIASGTYDHCMGLGPNTPPNRAVLPVEIYLDKVSGKGTVQFSIFPNPGSAVRNVGFRSSDELDAARSSITLLDAGGKERMVWSGQLSGRAGTIENLDFGSLPNGNYFIIFKVDGIKPVTAQFVKSSGK